MLRVVFQDKSKHDFDADAVVKDTKLADLLVLCKKEVKVAFIKLGRIESIEFLPEPAK